MSSSKRDKREAECTSLAIEIFDAILAEFPTFRVEREFGDFTSVEIRIPVQPGIKFNCTLALSNVDELGFGVEQFWDNWFPCTDQRVTDAYMKAVRGYLRGEFKVVEYYRRGRCVRAELLEPVGATWQRVSSYDLSLFLAFPLNESVREFRNV